jgi:hypothetical protein
MEFCGHCPRVMVGGGVEKVHVILSAIVTGTRPNIVVVMWDPT